MERVELAWEAGRGRGGLRWSVWGCLGGMATQVVGREYNDRTVSCWSVGDSRREESGSSNSGSLDSEGEARERGFR